MKQSDGFVTMFSLTDQDSFQATQEFQEQILGVKKDDTIPLILFGWQQKWPHWPACKNDFKGEECDKKAEMRHDLKRKIWSWTHFCTQKTQD